MIAWAPLIKSAPRFPIVLPRRADSGMSARRRLGAGLLTASRRSACGYWLVRCREMGRAVRWAVVVGLILLFSNLCYYGYQVLIVDGYGSGAPVPTNPNITVDKPSPSPSAATASGAVLLAVPFSTQAPLGDWGKHQESCEEANLA